MEPKVALATERTFLSWLEFSIILGSIAAALLNFQSPLDNKFTPPANGTDSAFASHMGSRASNSTNGPGHQGQKGLPINIISAAAFTLTAVIALLYSLGLYLWRVDRISKRMSVNYHDWIGPTGLCGALFIAVLVSFGFRMFGWGQGVEWKG